MSCAAPRLLDPEVFELKQGGGESVHAALQLARALNGRCLHDRAQKVLDGILADHRANPDAWFERLVSAGDHASTDDLEALQEDLENLASEHPADAAILRNLGYLRILQQREGEAEPLLRRSLERQAADPRTLELLGLLRLHQDHPEEARNWFLKALSLSPRDCRTLRLLGICCEQMQDFKGAEAQLAAALEADPNYFWGWHSLGELLIRTGSMEVGLRCIHRARSIMAREASSYFILSEIFSEMGHQELAQAELHQLTALAPPAGTLSEAYAMIGEIRRDIGDREGAASYFTLAAETDPDASNPWYALGEMAREDERWEDALACYTAALERHPEGADIQVQLGYVRLRMGRHATAEAHFLAALEADPGEYSAYLGLSECYRHLQRQEDQMRMVDRALVLAPDDPDVWNARGVALEVAGRLPEATEAYGKALDLAPNHRKAANNLGFLLERRMAEEPALKDRAIEAWKRRLLICRDEGQSLKMAKEHLVRLGIPEETLRHWLEREGAPGR